MNFLLEHEPLLQGEFSLKEKNVAYIFQVNCPGCFIYGIPLINKWYREHKDNVGFIGISTCFEDYEYNTEENTLKLLKDGFMIGETKKYFESHQISKYPIPPLFPVAYDKTVPTKDYLTEELILEICSSIPGFETYDLQQANEIKSRIFAHYRTHPEMALTFNSNHLRGTPSYIFFDKEYNITQSVFGQLKSEDLNEYFDIND